MTETASSRTTAPLRGVGRVRLVSFGLDVVFVILFVALGRDAHREGSAVGGTLTVAAPFLIALGVAWLVVLATAQRTPGTRLAPTAVAFGVPVWIGTLILGMLLRRTVFERGTAFAFVLVALIVLGVFLVGWRAAWSWYRRRSSRHA